MNVTKVEKIWLITTIVLFLLYNIPGVPMYGNDNGLLVHGILTVIPLWIVSYVGMTKIYKIYKLREIKEDK